MSQHSVPNQQVADGVQAEPKSHAVGHFVATIGGLLLAIVGLAMGVSVVLLPVAIPVGLVGMVVLIWGLFTWSRS